MGRVLHGTRGLKPRLDNYYCETIESRPSRDARIETTQQRRGKDDNKSRPSRDARIETLPLGICCKGQSGRVLHGTRGLKPLLSLPLPFGIGRRVLHGTRGLKLLALYGFRFWQSRVLHGTRGLKLPMACYPVWALPSRPSRDARIETSVKFNIRRFINVASFTGRAD